MARFQCLRSAAIAVALGCLLAISLLAIVPALAEDQAQPAAKADKDKADKPAKPKKPFGGGSPLEVIINNKLWTDEPKPQDFVIQNRRPADELHYQPTVGTDPERPKTLNKDELKSLQSEMEAAKTHNANAVTGKPDPKPPVKPKPKTDDEKPLKIN
jgi:hypothetical protein